ncbi:pectinesterase family protein, partial [Ralstonia pseudosolanacearum]|uniref:pectinesterase family protein n=1 Tax=Ralstonia pseudosolanacearum TaxID=1310165 RepID=UPI003CEE7F6A
QDTMLYHAERSFFRNCIISGTVDFIFGKGSCVIQNSRIIARLGMKGNMNTVTADGREYAREPTGLVIQNCDLVAEAQLEPNKAKIPSYLGRPWSAYSTTMVMESRIGDFLRPEGWMKWNETSKFENSCEYREYGNKGPGADKSKRVKWPGFKVVDKAQAEKYTITRFSRGSLRALKPSGVPFTFGFAA